MYEDVSHEQVDDDEVKYDKELHVEGSIEDISEEFAAMITVEFDTMGQGLDVSEFVALAKEAHTIHLDSCCTHHMTGFYNLAKPTPRVCKVMGALKGGSLLIPLKWEFSDWGTYRLRGHFMSQACCTLLFQSRN